MGEDEEKSIFSGGRFGDFDIRVQKQGPRAHDNPSLGFDSFS